MDRENHKIEDLVKRVGSFWLVGLILVYISNERAFFQALSFSLIVLAIIFAMVMLSRKRRFNDIFEGVDDHGLIEKLKQIKSDEFEDFIAVLFRRLGYQTHRVGGPNENGIDVTAKKGEVIHYIKCKKYTGSKITIGEIQSFYNIVINNPATGRGIFVTTNAFTTEAVDFARDKSIEIIDEIKLSKLIKLAANSEEVPEVVNKQSSRCCR